MIELFLDNRERHEPVLLKVQDRFESPNVPLGIQAVSPRGPRRVDQPLVLQIPDLGNSEIWILGLQALNYFANGQVAGVRHNET